MLYTGKGDGGTTTAFGCDQQRISKASELPEALGALDELNSYLGLAKVEAKERASGLLPSKDKMSLPQALRELQEMLFIVQAELAGADKHIPKERVLWVEEITNAIEKEIPPIKNFSIAGGTELSAMLDVARTVARRAERRLIAVQDAKIREVSEHTRAFMNRLSSLLFALARFANFAAGVAEENPRY